MTFIWCVKISIRCWCGGVSHEKIPSRVLITVVTRTRNLYFLHAPSVDTLNFLIQSEVWRTFRLYLTLIRTRWSPREGWRFKLSSTTLTQTEPRSIKHHDRWPMHYFQKHADNISMPSKCYPHQTLSTLFLRANIIHMPSLWQWCVPKFCHC